MSLSISYISYNNGDSPLRERSVQILDSFFKGMEYEFTDVSEEVFFIASGGSERLALDHSKLRNQIILLCHRESNSYAATMEIAAYLRSLDKKVLIIDVFTHNALDQFLNGLKAFGAINKLKGEKAAVIGDVSEWLIHSDIDKNILESKLGIELTKIQWEQIGDFRTYSESSSFISNFNGVKALGRYDSNP